MSFRQLNFVEVEIFVTSDVSVLRSSTMAIPRRL
jgi:hypothetical protein